MKLIKQCRVPECIHEIHMEVKALNDMCVTYMRWGIHDLAKSAAIEYNKKKHEFWTEVFKLHPALRGKAVGYSEFTRCVGEAITEDPGFIVSDPGPDPELPKNN